MEKIKVLISLVLVSLLLSGCGNKTENATEAVNLNTEAVESFSSESNNGLTETEKPIASDTEAVTQATTIEESTTAKANKAEKTTVAVSSSEKPKPTKEQTEKTTSAKPKPTASTTEKKTDVCYITIACDTINNNINDLKDSKKQFVPSDGVILENVAVEFEKGDTAFDVLKKVCAENHCKANCRYCKNGVQIEYTYTPAFDTYYVEGIHQLYEKDCGMQSGWMYSVNGVFPNVGSSSYGVKTGDKIIFAYTCDMGEDIGNY